MNFRRMVQVVDTHTAGEPTRVVTAGFPLPPGGTMEERRRWLADNADELRGFLLREPRGHSDMFGALVLLPVDPRADIGLIFLDNGGYLTMCGHGTIGAVTALATLGGITGDEVAVDTPAGLVHCRIERSGGEVQAVAFRNVASFYLQTVEIDGTPVAISYGGNLFALVNADNVGLALSRENLSQLVARGLEIRAQINAEQSFTHPGTGERLAVELVEFYTEGPPARNVAVFGHGQVDRSPCGTGTSAKMALLHARGELEVGEEYHYRSIIDTEFVGRIVDEVQVGDRPGIIPEVRGSAHITGLGTLVLTEDDPFPAGFRLTTS